MVTNNLTFTYLGGWTKEEEDKLTEIVTDMTVKQGKDIDNDVFWGVVSDRMGGKRGRQQCRIKWCVTSAKFLVNQILNLIKDRCSK